MNRHRDHLAPSSLTDDQLEGIKILIRSAVFESKDSLLRTRYGPFTGRLKRLRALILIASKSMKSSSEKLHEYGLSIGGKRRSNLERITSTLCLA